MRPRLKIGECDVRGLEGGHYQRAGRSCERTELVEDTIDEEDLVFALLSSRRNGCVILMFVLVNLQRAGQDTSHSCSAGP